MNSYTANCFKPYYKWNTFNTLDKSLNCLNFLKSFKPCYKWNTFNTKVVKYATYATSAF